MHIEYRVNQRDYVSAAMLALKKRSNWSLLEYYLPHAFAMLWIGIAISSGRVDLSNSNDLVFTLGVLPVMLGFLLLRRTRVQRDYMRVRQYQLLHELDLDANGLRLATSAGVFRMSWDLYSRWAESKSVFILFQNNEHDFFPIAKEHLRDAQNTELRTLLATRLAKA